MYFLKKIIRNRPLCKVWSCRQQLGELGISVCCLSGVHFWKA